jgi:hypothetical protein
MEWGLAAALAALGVWFVMDSLRAREHAVDMGRQACEKHGLLFLDDTVHCVQTRLARNDAGRMLVRRLYAFEFSDTGNNRRMGSIVMLGAQPLALEMEPYYNR